MLISYRWTASRTFISFKTFSESCCIISIRHSRRRLANSSRFRTTVALLFMRNKKCSCISVCAQTHNLQINDYKSYSQINLSVHWIKSPWAYCIPLWNKGRIFSTDKSPFKIAAQSSLKPETSYSVASCINSNASIISTSDFPV